MSNQGITIRPANKDDLRSINQVIEKALMTWKLPDRVKRLVLPSYFYDEVDLEHFLIFVAVEADSIIGVASLDTQSQRVEGNYSALLLHGMFIDPARQRSGIGSQLLEHAENLIREHKVDALIVKVQKDAEEFFKAKGLKKLAVNDPDREYENQYWKLVG
jgi:N-acetylglutamate synthase-like GNAT family acetyltransferase